MANTTSMVIGRAILELGVTGLTDTETEINKLKGDLQLLKGQYQANAVGIQEYTKRSEEINREIMRLGGGLQVASDALMKHGTAVAAAAAVTDQLNASTKAIGGNSRMGVMGLMALSNAIDDVQYGFHSIVNNIPMMATGLASLAGKSMEASMAFGAIAQIAAVGLNLAIPFLEKQIKQLEIFGRDLKDAKTGTENLHKAMDDINAKKVKLAVDQSSLENAQKSLDRIEGALRTVKELGEIKEHDHQAVGAGVKELLESEPGGGKKLIEDLVTKRVKTITDPLGPANAAKAVELQENVDIWNRKLFEARESGNVPGEAAARLRLMFSKSKQQEHLDHVDAEQRKIRQSIAVDVGLAQQGAEAGNDPVVRAKFARLLKEAGHVGLGTAIEELTPEELRNRHKATEWAEQEGKKHKAEMDEEKRVKKADDDKKATDAQREAHETMQDALNTVRAGTEFNQFASDQYEKLKGTPVQKQAALKPILEKELTERVKPMVSNFMGTEDEIAAAARQEAGEAPGERKLGGQST